MTTPPTQETADAVIEITDSDSVPGIEAPEPPTEREDPMETTPPPLPSAPAVAPEGSTGTTSPTPQAPGTPEAPKGADPHPLPPRIPVPEPHDFTRDRLRVVFDRVLYAGALGLVGYLQVHGKLDGTIVATVLLLVGIRPHNLVDAFLRPVANQTGKPGGSAPLFLLGALGSQNPVIRARVLEIIRSVFST